MQMQMQLRPVLLLRRSPGRKSRRRMSGHFVLVQVAARQQGVGVGVGVGRGSAGAMPAPQLAPLCLLLLGLCEQQLPPGRG
jgi:hypothetical protein